MGRRQRFGGLFGSILRSVFIVTLLLRAVSCAHTPHAGQLHDDSFHAQGRICLYVDVQDEFDKTVKAVAEVLDFDDETFQAKLNRTIYKGLLNHVIGQSAYLNDIEDELPKADHKVVEKLEEAGFVVLANLAKKDYSVTVGTSDGTGLTSAQATANSGSGNQLEADGVQVKSPRDKHSSHIEGQYKYSISHVEGENQNGASPHKHCHSTTRPQTGNCQGTTPAEDIGTKPTQLDRTTLKKSSAPIGLIPNQPTARSSSNHSETARNQRTDKSAAHGGQQPIETTSPSPHVTTVGQSTSQRVAPEHGQDPPGNLNDDRRLVNGEGTPIIEDDLYWSTAIEAATPKGFSELEIDEWKNRLSTQTIRSFEPGSIRKCGREKNRFIVLDDGSKLCVRYRYPLITSMTGELYSYHLARMLGLANLPPLHVSIATANSKFWLRQTSNFQEAEWEDGRAVLLTKWIDGLDDAYFPETFIEGPLPVGAQNKGLRNLTMTELTSLLQWSDLLLFDYLIAHFDRFTINLSSVRHYNDTSLLRSPVHNLVQHPQTKQLWIVDNESGLIDGYSFLLVEGNNDSLLQGELHEEMLHKVCIFRRSTVERVRALLSHPNPAKLLSDRVRREDPAGEGVFPAIDKIHRHAGVLKKRLGKIHDWAVECQKQNSRERLKR